MPALSVKLTKDWTITPNLRNAYVSLADMTGWLLYQNKAAMLAAGWTIKWTSDGTTGPSGVGDTTDRWTTKTEASTRGANAASPQSYAVVQNADGVQVLLTFQGATDDIGRISYSPTGVFTLDVTTTHQPTAADEMVVAAATSLVDNSVDGDRVLTIWCSDDTLHWSHVVARAGSFNHLIGVERINSLCGPGVFAVPYVGYRHTSFDRGNNPPAVNPNPVGAITGTAVGAANFRGVFARVFTAAAFRTVRVGAGFLNFTMTADGFTRTFNNANNPLTSPTPGFQNGRTPLTPLFWTGEKAANLDGFLGSPIDWWLSHSDNNDTTPALGNFFPGYDPADNPLVDPERTNWLVALGSSVVRPWRNAAPVLRSI
jgi:hypothetical protein